MRTMGASREGHLLRTISVYGIEALAAAFRNRMPTRLINTWASRAAAFTEGA